MTFADPNLLARVRAERCCWCGKASPSDPAHIFARGFGGGSRLDVAFNVVPLCRSCHDDQHAGRQPTVTDLLAIAAQRCGVMQGTIEAAVHLLRRVPNGATRTQVRAAMNEVGPAARRLVREVLRARAA